MKKKNLPYINREVAWLSFNERVLQEAADSTTPLLERIKFLAIYSNNRDEFYRVRVATVKRMLPLGKRAIPLIGANPNDVLDTILKRVLEQQKRFEEIYQELLKELKHQKVFMVNEKELDEKQQLLVRDFFHERVISNIFPILLDETKHFPSLRDKSSYLFIRLQNKITLKTSYALIEVPTKTMSRFFALPTVFEKHYIILLDDIIRFCADEIFSVLGMKALDSYNIKLTRDAELEIDNDVSHNIVDKISKGLKKRKKGLPVRLVFDESMPEDMKAFLIKKINLTKQDAPIPGGRYHNFKDFIDFPDVGRKDLQYKKTKPIEHKLLSNYKTSSLQSIRNQDILLVFPYHPFDHIIGILREASMDPLVEDIKITIYRLADSSKIANALINALKNGKKVTMVVELQARFDEENNLYWANKLQEEGATIIYGVPKLKVHSKLFLITAKEKGKLVQYAHIGTGNFNEKTAKIYTDVSLLTCDKKICKEVSKVFEFFSDNFKVGHYKQLAVAPFNMRSTFVKLISKEIANAQTGKNAWIILKVNNLVDRDIINKLYQASQAGVKIKLIIRGICSLICGVKDVSENIEGVSIVDKYLEHMRIFAFANNGEEKYYLSSADWMTRNLDHRCEVAVHVKDKNVQKILKTILEIQLSGNTKARILDQTLSNKYKKPRAGDAHIRAQDEVYNYLLDANKQITPLKHAVTD
ncbi:MAG TPA: polyphosphate kinase 1 [Bacteroidia bacterium]|jgi:polyphosphate kinase|nr:polyphosphate kinase 1 [Bacteroidia bacterium]